MQFDPTAILYTLEDGKPFIAEQRPTEETNSDGSPVLENVPLTLGIAIVRAMQTPDKGISAEETIRRAKTCFEVIAAMDNEVPLEWESSKITDVKKLCLALWVQPVLYFRIDELLEGRGGGKLAEEIDKLKAGPLAQPEG